MKPKYIPPKNYQDMMDILNEIHASLTHGYQQEPYDSTYVSIEMLEECMAIIEQFSEET